MREGHVASEGELLRERKLYLGALVEYDSLDRFIVTRVDLMKYVDWTDTNTGPGLGYHTVCWDVALFGGDDERFCMRVNETCRPKIVTRGGTP